MGRGRNVCIAECTSLYALIEPCYGLSTANSFATFYCGSFNKQNCSSLESNDTLLRNAVYTACSNSTYCSFKCRSAITALEQYGGCCYADGPKVLCGQQPIHYCSTILNIDTSTTTNASNFTPITTSNSSGTPLMYSINGLLTLLLIAVLVAEAKM